MKKHALCCLVVVSCASLAPADILVLQTGRALFGHISSDIGNETHIRGRGKESAIAQENIQAVFRQEQIPEDFRLVVTLNDRSVIRGRLAEYDDGLGLFIDIEYRVLNIPWDRIADVYTAESIARRSNPVLLIYHLADGRIIIGEGGPRTLFKETVHGLGGDETIDLDKIDRIDMGIQTLADEGLEIALRDHTVILGEIVGYDTMLGLLVDISFGTLNIPPDQIRSIHTSNRRRGSTRDLLSFGAGCVAMVPIVSTPVEYAVGPEASIRLRLPFFHGISVGQNVRYLFMTAPDYPELEYFYASVSLDIAFEFLPLLTKKDVRYPVSPYLLLSGGAGIVGVVDKEYDDHQGGLDAVTSINLGATIQLRGLPSLRIAACIDAVSQDSGIFALVGARASLLF